MTITRLDCTHSGHVNSFSARTDCNLIDMLVGGGMSGHKVLQLRRIWEDLATSVLDRPSIDEA